jgi:ribonuclease HI
VGLKEGELMLVEILIIIAVAVTGVLYLWPVRAQSWASALATGSSLPFRWRSSRKRRGEEAAVTTPSTPPPRAVYIAGWCEPDPGPGGWAYVQVSDGTAREESGEHPDTTTIRMELTAAIKALEATAAGSTVHVYTASQLVQQSMTGWVHNGWRPGTSQPVENQDLWEKLRHLAEERRVRWEQLDVPMAEATDGQPPHHHVHAVLDAQWQWVAVQATAAHTDSQEEERGTPVHIEDTEQQGETRTQHMEPALMVRQETQAGVDDRRQALIAESRALERRWVELHEEVLHLDQEWQQLLSALNSHMEAQWNGQTLSWADGALMFYGLDNHAARTSSLAHEALQTCHRYALTLQRVLDATAER